MQDAASERQGEEGVQRCSEVEAGHGVRQGQHRTRDETKRPVRLDAGPRSERAFRCQVFCTRPKLRHGDGGDSGRFDENCRDLESLASLDVSGCSGQQPVGAGQRCCGCCGCCGPGLGGVDRGRASWTREGEEGNQIK